MLEDGDSVLNLIGVVLVVALVVAVGVLAINFDPPADDPAPSANWTVERVNATHVEVTHDGGDPIPTDELRVTVDSVRRSTDWPDPVVPGASAVVDASESARVRVVWVGGRGNRAVLESWRV
jgi:FlaG/FlaF family flagellin (archaellin)